MSEPNKEHLKILAEVMKRKTIELAALVDVTDCLAAMQILQLRIDELEKENAKLKHELSRFIKVDFPKLIKPEEQPKVIEHKLRELKNPKNPE